MARKPLPSVAVAERAARPDAGGGLRRLLLAALGAAVLTAVMSGCVIIKSNSSQQLEVIGKVQVTTRFCASDISNPANNNYSPPDTICQKNVPGGNPNAGGNSASDAANGQIQLKVAYRINNSAIEPSSFVSTEPSGGGAITFNQNTGLANAIEALSPSGADYKWVGYLSTAQTYSQAGSQYVTVAPQFGLGQFLTVVPFFTPFNYRVIVGFRVVTASLPASRPATCGSSLTTLYTDAGGNPEGICADDPNAATIATDVPQATRDLGVLPTHTAAQAGSTVQVPFDLWYSGAALPAGHFNITASTNIPGATATPSITTLTPAAAPTSSDGHNNMTVSVPIPPDTQPGSYSVKAITTLSTNPTQVRGNLNGATVTVGEAFGFSPAPDVPSFGTVTLTGEAQTKDRTLSDFGVLDSPGGSDQGWNVTVVGDNTSGKSPVFKQYCPPSTGGCGAHPVGYVADGLTLSANSITLDTSGASWSGGTNPAPSFHCNAGGCMVDSATPFKIVSAPNGGGTGLWNATGFSSTSLQLAVPSTMRAVPAEETYHLDLVFTLNSGP